MDMFPNPELARQWRERIGRFDDAGTIIAEFCHAEGYSVASFYQSSQRYTVFSTRDIEPATTDKFERRLERCCRELARLIMQRTIRRLESDKLGQTASSFVFGGEHY